MPEPAMGGVLGLAALCGQVALVISVLVVLVGVCVVWPRARKVRRRANSIQAYARGEEALLTDAVVLLLAQIMEINRLLEPWLRLRFWLRHPLTRALGSQYLHR